MRPPTLAAKCAFLRDPRHYPDKTPYVTSIETHFAWVFLTRRFAYKLKKPIQRQPLDYRTRAQRRNACLQELELNRRLAPGVYLAVLPLTLRANGRLQIGGAGQTVDYLLKMKRLPAARMLDRVLLSGSVGGAMLRSLARQLAEFHAMATPAPVLAGAYCRELRRRILDNSRVLGGRAVGLDPGRIAALQRLQLRALARMRARIGARGASVREVHGDLRPEHVCLQSPPLIIDALEFDRHLRTLDPLEEVAYLSMECRMLGAAEFAGRLTAAYTRSGGDACEPQLLAFYMSGRAANRAKIMSWRVRESQGRDADLFRRRANDYLSAAIRFALAAQPVR